MNWDNIMIWVVGGAGTLLALVLAFLGVKYRAYIAEKVKNQKVAGVLERLGTFAFQVVSELNQTVVDQLKKDGKWNAEEAGKVAKLALDKLKSYLGPAGIKEAMTILGISNAVLESLLISFIETQVVSEQQAKARLAAAAAA